MKSTWQNLYATSLSSSSSALHQQSFSSLPLTHPKSLIYKPIRISKFQGFYPFETPMGKKRKSEATRLDEVDRTMYGAFRGAANSLSQLYTHAMNHQRVSFLAGERRGMEKLYQWIVRQQEEGTRVSTVDIITYLQNELENEPEETSIPFPVQEFHQQQFAPPNVNTSFAHVPSIHIAQHYDCNQEKVLIPPNGLSSPVRRTLQDFNLCEAESGNNHNPNSIGEELSY